MTQKRLEPLEAYLWLDLSMGLQALTLSAVEKMKSALGDLTVDMTLKTRVANTHVPGTSVSYATTDVSVKGVITKFRDEEVDGAAILRTDILVIMFPPANKAIPKPNDVLVHGDDQWRVVSSNPLYVGSEIAYSMVQVRPPV